MDEKKIFRGFKQVSFDTFDAVEDKSGYLWFVRKDVIAEGENADANDVSNDSYDIYFGSRHYGHFCEGEIESIKSAITELGGDVDGIVSTLETLTTAIANNKKAHEDNASAIAALDNKFADHFSTVSYEGNKILFKNANGDVKGEVDATPFVKDGILDDVEVVTIEEVDEENNPHGLVAGEKYIKFVWNTDGDSKEDYILASEIGATYAGSDSIEISSENIVSLKSASADKVQVTEIPVGGTPLADLLTAKNINTINAGNLQTVLESLFSQNNWAENPRRNVPTSLTVSMSAPSISLTKTGTQEVGTSVSLSASAKTASASASITYSGFTYGYSVENDNTRDAEGNPSSVSVTGEVKSGSTYQLSFVTNNGFGGVDVADVTGSSTSGNALVVAEGTNKVTVTAKSPEFTATVPAQDAIYACSSLKKTDEDHVVAASSATTISGSVKSATANTSVTGAYYAFIGYSDTLPTTNDEYRAFIDNGLSRLGKGGSLAGTCDKTYFAVCIPADWDFSCNTSLGSDMRNSFTETGDVTITLPNDATKAYKYYALTYKDGSFKELVIK
jgi:hypothetical protein